MFIGLYDNGFGTTIKGIENVRLSDLTTNINKPNKDKILFIGSIENFDTFTNKYGYVYDGCIGIKWSEVARDYKGFGLDTDLTDNRFLMAVYQSNTYTSWWDIEYYVNNFYTFVEDDSKEETLEEHSDEEGFGGYYEHIDGAENKVYYGNSPQVAASKAFTVYTQKLKDNNFSVPENVFIRIKEIHKNVNTPSKVYIYSCCREKLDPPMEIVIGDDSSGNHKTITYNHRNRVTLVV